jgi:RNA recognition motif-containing protein
MLLVALNAHVLYSEANKGLSDVGSIPLHVLLIRQLDKDVSADDLYKRFSQLGVIRRAWIIRDRESNASWGFGFIEFWDVNVSSIYCTIGQI